MEIIQNNLELSTHPEILNFEEAEAIYSEILLFQWFKDKEFLELWEDLIKSANEYAPYRAQWLTLSHSEKMEIDETRTTKHNLFIRNFTVIRRYVELNSGHDIFTPIGEDRKRIGDFACYLSYIYSINAR